MACCSTRAAFADPNDTQKYSYYSKSAISLLNECIFLRFSISDVPCVND